jgi:hypothetical protein
MSLITFDDTRTLFDGIERHNIVFWENGRAAVSQCERLMSLHGMTIYVTEYVTSVPEFVGRVIMFFKASVGPGVHTSHSDVRSLAFVEEYWRLPPQPSDPLCSEFGCVRLYSTTPKVYYVMDTWRILGPAPIIRNAVHPTIPHGALPRTQAQRQRDYPEAKEDSKAGEGDGSPQWIVNMWAMMWGSKRPTPGELHDNMNFYITQSPNVHDTIRRRK